MDREKALVMGDDTRGFLATVRSLGRKGIEVHAAPADFRSPALASRYIAAVHDIPPWMDGGTEWLASVRALLAEQRYALVIPCDERNLLPLQRHRDELSRLARLAIPDDRSIEILFDKHATRELAKTVGVKIAPGRLARTDEVPEDVLREFGGQVVVKPRRSYTLDGLATRGKVQILSDPGRLRRFLDDTDADSLVLEGVFEGDGVGVSILASKGRLLQAFQHHRVHERSGSSFYRISAPLDPELVEACAAIARGVEYTGLAMYEFRRAPSGDWVLLEVNARPWGSLPLPVSLGVDFPYRWYRLLVHGEETPPVPYRAGVYARNLLPDVMASVADAQAHGLPPWRTALFVAHRLTAMRRMVTGGEHQDVFVRDDLGPARAELRQLVSRAGDRIGRKLPGAAGRTQGLAVATVRHVAAAGRPVHVLFVCQGNICRSPYAEAMFRARVPDPAKAIATSAGTMPRPGRTTPEGGLRAALGYGVQLATHRSTWLRRETAEAASLIVAFDELNLDSMADRYPDVATPTIKLGDLIGLPDIADPVDGDTMVFERTYAEIGAATSVLAKLLA